MWNFQHDFWRATCQLRVFLIQYEIYVCKYKGEFLTLKRLIPMLLLLCVLLSACSTPRDWSIVEKYGEIMILPEKETVTQDETDPTSYAETIPVEPPTAKKAHIEYPTTSTVPIEQKHTEPKQKPTEKEAKPQVSLFSNYGFYYNQLSENEKKIYRTIYDNINEGIEETRFETINEDIFYKIQFAINYDHPEFFWINSFTMKTIDDDIVGVKYNIPENIEAINNKINEKASAVLSKTASFYRQYDKIKYIYDWIVNNVEYKDTENDQNIQSVFLEGKSVCAGYSRAFQYLCVKAGISCTYISGKLTNGESHAWNLVFLDGNYYWVDVTWGDPLYSENIETAPISYNYFCVSDKDLLVNHIPNKKISTTTHTTKNDMFSYPKCISEKYNYYKLNNAYFNRYDRDEIKEFFFEKFKAKIVKNIEFRFENQVMWKEAFNDMFDGDTPYVSQIILEYYGAKIKNVSYSYTYIEEANYYCVSINF